MTVKQLVSLVMAGTESGRKFSSPAHRIAQGVMGRIAWKCFKNAEFKAMKGPRKPISSNPSNAHKVARNKRLGGP